MFNKCDKSGYLLSFISYELYETAKQFTETRTKALLPFTSNIKNEMIPVNFFSNVSQLI